MVVCGLSRLRGRHEGHPPARRSSSRTPNSRFSNRPSERCRRPQPTTSYSRVRCPTQATPRPSKPVPPLSRAGHALPPREVYLLRPQPTADVAPSPRLTRPTLRILPPRIVHRSSDRLPRAELRRSIPSGSKSARRAVPNPRALPPDGRESRSELPLGLAFGVRCSDPESLRKTGTRTPRP